MPLYDYYCDTCSHEEELYHNPTPESCRVKECPACHTLSFHIVITKPPTAFVRDNPKTVGGVAYMNNRKMGKLEYEDRVKKDQDDRRAAIQQRKEAGKLQEGWTRPEVNHDHKVDLSLTKLTPEQQKKYIETGKKP